ncbi:MAG: transglutaminase-like domain-containing protein [Thermosphaera sp.]
MKWVEKVLIVTFSIGFILMSFNYFLLNESYHRLEENYKDLNSKYENLKAERDALLQNLTSVERSFNETLSLYESWLKGNISSIPILLEKIIYLSNTLSWYRNSLSSPQGIDYLEKLTQQDRNLFLQRAVSSVPEDLPLDEYVNRYGVPMAIPIYVSLITYYQPDPVVVKEYWKMPNETLVDLGGDCEDLSLLVFSILVKTGHTRTYLVQWVGDSVGHVAVLTYISGKWYLIDTAGNWYNGLKSYLSLKISKINYTYEAKIPPLTIRPEIKDWLISSGYAYVDLTVPPNQEFIDGSDLYFLLNQWVYYWTSNGAHPTEYRVVGFNIYYGSSSLVQLVNYIKSVTR